MARIRILNSSPLDIENLISDQFYSASSYVPSSQVAYFDVQSSSVVTVTGSQVPSQVGTMTSIALSTYSNYMNNAAASVVVDELSLSNNSFAAWRNATSEAARWAYINAGDDLYIGGSGADSMHSGNGADTVRGGAGADTMDGGDGIDTLDYSTSGLGVTLTLSNGTGSGGDAQGDTNTNFENVTGSDFADRLVGDTGDNVISGGKGADVLAGGAGADSLVGGDDFDIATYFSESAAVTVDLRDATGASNGGVALGDTFSGIERLHLSNFDDTYYGSDTAGAVNEVRGYGGNDKLYAGGVGTTNTLAGGAGDDRIYGSAGTTTATGDNGEDSMSGGSGVDTFSGGIDNDYLAGGGGGDTLNGDNGNDGIYGEDGADKLFGGTGADFLSGGNDNDRLYGGIGNDVMNGGSGNDYLLGGLGADTFVFDLQDTGRDTIVYFDKGSDHLQFINMSIDDISLRQVGTRAEITYGDHAAQIFVYSISNATELQQLKDGLEFIVS